MPQTKKDAAHRYFTYDKVSNTSLCQLCNKNLKICIRCLSLCSVDSLALLSFKPEHSGGYTLLLVGRISGYAYAVGKHTTNLKNHLSAKHETEFQVVTGINKTGSTENNNLKDNDTSPILEIIKNLCVRLVTVHGRPLAMMEDEAFQEIINIATNSKDGYTHINVKTIKNEIQQVAYNIKRKISNETKNKLVSMKLDSATYLKRKFIGVNIQYIKNACIVVRNLTILEVKDCQTATFLRNRLEDVLAEFMISPNKIYSICTDNGNNMIKMVKLIGGKYDSQDDNSFLNENPNDDNNDVVENNEDTTDDIFELNTDDILPIESPFRVRGMVCAAHTLQLAIKDANNADTNGQPAILIAKKITNILRKPKILDLINQTNLKKPIKECNTRWMATYNMLDRLVELKEFCSTIPEISPLVSDRFWSDITALIECYKPAYEATIALQKQDLTMGDFFIIWLNCKNKVAAIQQDFAKALHDAMEQREIKLLQNDVVLEGLYLDRRLNVILSETQCKKARFLLNEVYQQLRNLKAQNGVCTESTLSLDVPTTSRALPNSDLAAVESLLLNTEKVRGKLRQSRSFDACLYDVVTTPRLSLTENIISHWNNTLISSSDLAQVANIVLAAPVTQVSVERLFSSLKFILDPLRNNINNKILMDLMLIKSNKEML